MPPSSLYAMEVSVRRVLLFALALGLCAGVTALVLEWLASSDGVGSRLRGMARGNVALECWVGEPMLYYVDRETEVAEVLRGACRDKGWKLETEHNGDMVITKGTFLRSIRITFYSGRQYEGLPSTATCSVLIEEATWPGRLVQ